MANIRTSRGFSKLSDGQLGDFSGAVITGITDNKTAFPAPPVTVGDLETLKTTFDDAVIKAAGGGRMNTTAKNAAREALITALNKDASYVDIACNGDLTILLSSGFRQVSTNRAQNVLPQPQVVAVDYFQTGVLKVRVRADANAKSYVGRIKQSSGSEFGPSISFASSRKILFKGLTAGATYVMQLCAVGGSTGQSDWSEPVSKMSM